MTVRTAWLALSLLACAPARAALCPVPISVPGTPLPAEAVPTPSKDAYWLDRVGKLDAQLAATDLASIRTLFLGDSITQGWAPLIFDQFYGTRAPLNLGVRSDNTQGLLWRLARLPLGTSLRPRLVVLLIGTNDLWPGANPHQVAAGIAQVLHTIRTRSPQSRVVLVGLLPRGQLPADPYRALVAGVNSAIRPCADGRMVTYAEPGTMLTDGNGVLSNQITFDYLHPTWMGYAILAAALEPSIRHVLADR